MFNILVNETNIDKFINSCEFKKTYETDEIEIFSFIKKQLDIKNLFLYSLGNTRIFGASKKNSKIKFNVKVTGEIKKICEKIKNKFPKIIIPIFEDRFVVNVSRNEKINLFAKKKKIINLKKINELQREVPLLKYWNTQSNGIHVSGNMTLKFKCIFIKETNKYFLKIYGTNINIGYVRKNNTYVRTNNFGSKKINVTNILNRRQLTLSLF